MASASLPANSTAPAATEQPPLRPFAGLLSYLVPGLGQIYQGRVGKGVLFLVCIYTLFFYGQYLGTMTVQFEGQTYHVSGSVYLPDMPEDTERPPLVPVWARNFYTRPQFVAQFWAGVVAWPAIIQYLHTRDARRAGAEGAVGAVGPEVPAHPYLGDYEREPSAAALSAVHNAGDKRLELAWVYTVIAGVLNILVIYDAVAGPAFGAQPQQPSRPE